LETTTRLFSIPHFHHQCWRRNTRASPTMHVALHKRQESSPSNISDPRTIWATAWPSHCHQQNSTASSDHYCFNDLEPPDNICVNHDWRRMHMKKTCNGTTTIATCMEIVGFHMEKDWIKWVWDWRMCWMHYRVCISNILGEYEQITWCGVCECADWACDQIRGIFWSGEMWADLRMMTWMENDRGKTWIERTFPDEPGVITLWILVQTGVSVAGTHSGRHCSRYALGKIYGASTSHGQ